MVDAFLGEIHPFASSFAPRGWMLCNGQILEIARYQALFNLLLNRFGGNGQTTFALPDLRGHVAVGTGVVQVDGQTTKFDLGVAGGAAGVPLNSTHLPQHDHAIIATVKVGDGAATGRQPNGTYVAATSANANGPNLLYASKSGHNNKMADGFVQGNTQVYGQGQPFSVMQPFLALNYIICVAGIYPPRP